jgi:hypothetical protein
VFRNLRSLVRISLLPLAFCGGIFVIGVSPAMADDFANQIAALEAIKKAASDICYTVQQEGSHSNLQLSGEARAQLDTAISRVADLGFRGAGQYTSDQYKGVLQEELAATIKSSIDCRVDVFNRLIDRMLGWKPPPSQAAINQIADFVIEGEKISEGFVRTNDTALLTKQYLQWSTKVENYLSQMLDRAYAAEFRTAQPINYIKDGMRWDGAGTWQKLRGQISGLSQIVAELRHSA